MPARRPPPKASAPDRNHRVAAVAAAFEVLEIFGARPWPLSFSQVVDLTGKPPASVHRILSTLVHLGVLRQDTNKLYELTFKLWSIGTSALAGKDLTAAAMPFIDRLAKATNETAHLSVLDTIGWATYLCKVESQQSVKVEYWVGKRVPSWRSAGGRVILAFRPQALDELQAVANREPGAAIDLAEIGRILRKVASQGYALTKGDNHPELGGISAPVRNHTGQVVASCGIAMPAYRMTRSVVAKCVPFVQKAAEDLSSELGHREIGNDADGGASAFAAMLKDL